MLESLEGKKGMPRFKPPFPASYGLYGKPTTINNTETFAAVPWIIMNGGDAFLALGKPNNGGTKVFSISGHVEQPGNFEIKLGTPFAKLLEMAGGMRGGRRLKACIPGGSSMPVLPGATMLQTDMDYDSIAKAGSMLGSGAVICMDETTCMVRALLRLSYFYYEESCGQCTPCREGTGWLYRMVDRIEHGRGTKDDLDKLISVSDNIAGPHHLRARAMRRRLPVKSFIKHFRDEFEYHIEHKRCLVEEPAYASLTTMPTTRLQQSSAHGHGQSRNRRQGDRGAGQLDGDRSRQPARHLHPAFLLSQEAVDRRQLPHVPGASGEGTQAAACLRHAGDRGHEGLHAFGGRHASAERRDGVSADQPSARLPDLRSGRRMPAAGSGGGLRRQQLALRRSRSASCRTSISGSLIATDMTRCIHCTRCVRFGQEIAGVMELGMIGRGEHAEIVQFVGQTVNSELSGNMIDLCPVGALTSKPFRFSARTWELARRKSISPHCGLGSNLVVQVKLDRVLRVLPRENEAINECWLSDKDRFSYEGLNSPERLTRPMIKREGKWEEVDWPIALEYVSQGLKAVRDKHGANAIGALASPHSTLEELFLLQRFMRGMGSGNVDFRLRQSDFSLDGELVRRAVAGHGRSPKSANSIACWWSAASCARIIRCSRIGCGRRRRKALSSACCTCWTTSS